MLADTKLNGYVVRRILGVWAVATLGFLGAFSLERLLRLMQLTAGSDAGWWKLGELLWYLSPHYLGLALPLGALASTMWVFRRMHEHSELVALRATGFSVRGLLVPVGMTGLLGAALLWACVAYGQPFGRHAYRETVRSIQTGGLLEGLRPGVLRRVGDEFVVRAREVGPEGRRFRGFFAVHPGERGGRVILTAREAELGADGVSLRLRDGILLRERGEMREGAGEADPVRSYLAFEVSDWSLGEAVRESRPRGRDARELTLGELGDRGFAGAGSRAERRAEWHARVSRVFSVPVLALAGVPLALIGTGRTGRVKGPLAGLVLFAGYEKFSGLGASAAAAGELSILPGLWVPWAGLTVLTALLAVRFSGDQKFTVFGPLVRLARGLSAGSPRAERGGRGQAG